MLIGPGSPQADEQRLRPPLCVNAPMQPGIMPHNIRL